MESSCIPFWIQYVISACRCICLYLSSLLPCSNVILCCISLNNTYSRAAVWRFFLSFSLLSVWHLLNLSGVYWCNNWCLHSPPSSSLWCSPCPHTMNTLASRLQNQLSRWEEGKSNLTAATRRGDCFSSQSQRSEPIVPVPPVLLERKKQRVKRGKLLGCSSWTTSLPQVKSHPFPPIFTLSFFPLPYPLILTLPIIHPATPGTTFLPPVLQMKRNNNYGDRVTLAAKLGPLRSQQHIVQPD